MFLDFMGYSMALKEYGVTGDFYSCFPIAEHFGYLSRKTPSVTTIKFGSYTPDKKDALYSYTRMQYTNGERWWTQYDPADLLRAVIDWIRDKTDKAQEGDVVNIIFESHGGSTLGLRLGSEHIRPAAYAVLIGRFKKGVHVNTISGACYSGKFADVVRIDQQFDRYVSTAAPADGLAFSCFRNASNRIRNSRFSQAVVQSLAKMNVPGVPRRKITWRLNNHEEFMHKQLTRNISPGAGIVLPYTHMAPPLHGMVAVEEMVLRDKIDFPYDPCVSARRRRMEWPTVDREILLAIQKSDTPLPSYQMPNPASNHAKQVVNTETAKCDTRTDFGPDIGIFNEFYTSDTRYWLMLRNLYWRARRQSAVWDVFCVLIGRGFINTDCLATPCDLMKPSKLARKVQNILQMFSYPVEDYNMIVHRKIPCQSYEWDYDLLWLAIMIVRSGVQLVKLFDTIESSGFLGQFGQEHLHIEDRVTDPLAVPNDPLDSQPSLLEDGTVPPRKNIFGFWLPHGTGSASELGACMQRWNDIETAFRKSEGLDEHQIWLEREQVDYFERHPERYPSGQFDIPQEVVAYDGSV